MQEYLRPNWMSVPFDSPDRSKLKQHFRTCAKNELDDLNMEDRDREIPALLVLCGETHQVLTYHGVEDIKQRGADALPHWLQLAEELVVKEKDDEEEGE